MSETKNRVKCPFTFSYLIVQKNIWYNSESFTLLTGPRKAVKVRRLLVTLDKLIFTLVNYSNKMRNCLKRKNITVALSYLTMHRRSTTFCICQGKTSSLLHTKYRSFTSWYSNIKNYQYMSYIVWLSNGVAFW